MDGNKRRATVIKLPDVTPGLFVCGNAGVDSAPHRLDLPAAIGVAASRLESLARAPGATGGAEDSG